MNGMDVDTFLQQLQGGAFGGDADLKQWSWWDTCLMPNAVTATHRLFTQGIGSPLGAGVKTLADTNMTTGGVMPQGVHFSAMALIVMYTTAAAKTGDMQDIQSLYTMIDETTVEIIRASRYTMGQWTLHELIGDCTQFAVEPSAAAAADNVPLNQPRFTGIYPLNEPIVFPALCEIEVDVQHWVAVPAALATDKLKISLAGSLIQAK